MKSFGRMVVLAKLLGLSCNEVYYSQCSCQCCLSYAANKIQVCIIVLHEC